MLFRDWDVTMLGKRVRITPMRMEDEPAYGRLLLGELYDRAVAVHGEATTGIESILNHTESTETHAIRPVHDDSFIGWIVLQKDLEGKPDIGISLIQECRNQGIGPEAITVFANRLHSEYGIERVYARISELNIQSQKAFSKIGAVLDKREPDYRMKKIVDALPEEEQKKEKNNDLLFFHLDLPIGTSHES